MLPAIGAAAIGALDLLSSLTSKGSGSSKAASAKPSTSLFSVADAKTSSNAAAATPVNTANGALSPSTFNALLSAQDSKSASPSDALKDLFGQIDSNGDGKITKAEFEDKLGAGGTNVQAADNVFSKLDTDGDGSVSMDELSSALKGKGGAHHVHHSGGGGGGGGADALMQALQGTSSTSTTNSDGSITTTLTYADGTKVTMNQPASATASSNASAKYNLVEQLVQRQANALSTAAKSSVSISA